MKTIDSHAILRAFGEQRSRIDDLERTNRELQGYASAAAHDLASPLNTVSAYLRLVHRRGEDRIDGELLELLELAMGGAERMRRVIDGMLEQARAGSTGDWTWIDLDELVEEVLGDLHADLDEAGALMEVGSLPSVYGDRGAIGRVLINLVLNAVRHATPGAPPRISITAIAQQRSWEVCVTDDGVGVAPQDSRRIFERFERDVSVSGSGMGLAACTAIVSLHGGRIWTESRESGGSRFCFTIGRPRTTVEGE